MAFRSQMKDVRDLMPANQINHLLFVPEIDILERIFGMLFNTTKVCKVAGIGQAIEIDQPVDR